MPGKRGRPEGYRFSDEKRAEISNKVRQNWEEERRPWVDVYNTLREVSNGDPELARSIIADIANHPRGADEDDQEDAPARPAYQDPFEQTKRIWAAIRQEEGVCDEHGLPRCGRCRIPNTTRVDQDSTGLELTDEEAARIGRELMSALPWSPTDDDVQQAISGLTAMLRESAKPEPPSHKRSSGAF